MRKETIKNALGTGAALAVALLPAVAFAQIFNPVNPFGGGPVLTGSSVLVVVRQVVNWIMTVSVLFGVVYFVYGGIRYAMNQPEDGGKIMKNAAIGIAAVLAVGLIVNSIAALVERGGQLG